MANVLFVKASPLPDNESRSTEVANFFLEEHIKLFPGDKIETLNLFKTDIPFIDDEVIHAWKKLRGTNRFNDLSDTEKNKINAIDKFTDQFIQADKIVIASPLWNLGIPPLLKAYFDTICIEGRTFQNTKQGPQGWLGSKIAIHIQSRGSVYTGTNIPEYSDAYVKGILNFLGVDVLPSIIIEGVDANSYEAAKTIELAKGEAKKALNDFKLMATL